MEYHPSTWNSQHPQHIFLARTDFGIVVSASPGPGSSTPGSWFPSCRRVHATWSNYRNQAPLGRTAWLAATTIKRRFQKHSVSCSCAGFGTLNRPGYIELALPGCVRIAPRQTEVSSPHMQSPIDDQAHICF